MSAVVPDAGAVMGAQPCANQAASGRHARSGDGDGNRDGSSISATAATPASVVAAQGRVQAAVAAVTLGDQTVARGTGGRPPKQLINVGQRPHATKAATCSHVVRTTNVLSVGAA